MKNKYKKQSHISISKTREIIKCFALDLTATNAAKLTDISRQTVNKYFDRFRKIILLESIDNFPSQGTFELDDHKVATKSILFWS